MKQEAEKEGLGPHIPIIVVSGIVAVLLMIGIIFLSIFMPSDVDRNPFEYFKEGIYTTQDDCADMFGSNNVQIEIQRVNIADVDGEDTLALISDIAVFNVIIDGVKADVNVLATYYDHGYAGFRFALYNRGITETIYCDLDNSIENALAFSLETEGQITNRVVFSPRG